MLQQQTSKQYGNVLSNSTPNMILSFAELKKFISASAENAISFAVNRNPTEVYNYIKLNYDKQFQNIKSGMQESNAAMNSMYDFLVERYYDLQENQRVHFLKTIIDSLPVKAETNNWTTPIN